MSTPGKSAADRAVEILYGQPGGRLRPLGQLEHLIAAAITEAEEQMRERCAKEAENAPVEHHQPNVARCAPCMAAVRIRALPIAGDGAGER